LLIRRALTATVIASLTVLGTTACNMASPVASLQMYAPSDGSQVDLGDLKARNLIYFVDNEGHFGFFGAFANSSSKEIDFNLGFTDAAGEKIFQQYSVGGFQVVNIGYQDQPALKIDLGEPAGSLVEITITSDAGTEYVKVPVLDGTLPEYRDLVASLSKN